MRNTEFLQPDKLPSEPISTQRQNPFKQHLSPQAGLWMLWHAFRWSWPGEGGSSGNHSASRPRFSSFSSQNKSICARTAEEWCRPRLRRMPHNKGPLNHDDQCSCHLRNHPRHARHGVIHHRSASPPHGARSYSPWAAAVVQLPPDSAPGTHLQKQSPLCPSTIPGSTCLL